jgi:hypothetical protein
MRELRKWAWAAAVTAATTAPAAAQQGTVTSTGSTTLGSLSGTGGLTGGGAGQLGGSGGGLGGSGGGLSGSTLQGTQLQSMQAAPKLNAPTGQASSTLQKSNFLSGYYANPYFQGTISAGTNGTPGGFGSALYGNTSGTTGSSGYGSTATGVGNRLGLTSGGGAGGAAGGLGRTGLGGLGGQNSANQSGIVVPIPVQLTYAAQVQFAAPPVATGRLLTEVRLAIDNTSMIANPKTVEVLTDADNNVVLRGTVQDDSEARLIEGLVRLTPGVRAIKNELTSAVAGR